MILCARSVIYCISFSHLHKSYFTYFILAPNEVQKIDKRKYTEDSITLQKNYVRLPKYVKNIITVKNWLYITNTLYLLRIDFVSKYDTFYVIPTMWLRNKNSYEGACRAWVCFPIIFTLYFKSANLDVKQKSLRGQFLAVSLGVCIGPPPHLENTLWTVYHITLFQKCVL